MDGEYHPTSNQGFVFVDIVPLQLLQFFPSFLPQILPPTTADTSTESKELALCYVSPCFACETVDYIRSVR